MGTIKKVVLFVVGILFTMVFIGDGNGYFGTSMALSKTIKGNFNSLTDQISNSSYSDYEDTTVSGSDAINAIRLHASDTFTVTVKTKRGSTSYTKSSGYNARSIDDKNFIEPTKNFESKLMTNDNGSVCGITLTQI